MSTMATEAALATMEQPDLFVDDVRAFFRTLL
jgi:hypothetical protein